MSSQNGGRGTLQLLEQYNEYISEKDKTIEYIEGNLVMENKQPSYDQLLKENIELKLKVDEYENEISKLKRLLEDTPRSVESVQSTVIIHNKTDVSIPPSNPDIKLSLPIRSTNRINNVNNNIEKSRISPSEDKVSNIDERLISDLNFSRNIDSLAEGNKKPNIKSKSNEAGAKQSESTSVNKTETLNSTTISPQKTISPSKERLESPLRANRVIAVINNHIHSPLSERYSPEREIDFIGDDFDQFTEIPHRSPGRKLKDEELTKQFESSPSHKEKINNFSDMLESTFSHPPDDHIISHLDIPSPKIGARPFVSPPSLQPAGTDAKLASPVVLQKPEIPNIKVPAPSFIEELHTENVGSHGTNYSDTLSERRLSTKSSQNYSSDIVISPAISRNNASFPDNSSYNNVESDIPLFIDPKDLGSVRVEISSTLYLDPDLNDQERRILISVIDRKSDKEIFKFAKSITKIYQLEDKIKPLLSSYSLPLLPDRGLFDSNIPSKVHSRRVKLNDFFTSLFSVPEIPPKIGLDIARFMSTDTVINPSYFGDTLKEGYLINRRQKTLGSAYNWRVRYGVFRDNYLELSEANEVIEQINLNNSTIEFVSENQDDKHGTKHAFLLTEHKKGGLSGNIRYYVCCETREERDLWVHTIKNNFGSKTDEKINNTSKQHVVTPTESSQQTDSSNDHSMSHSSRSIVSSPSRSMETPESDKDQRRSKRGFFPFKKGANFVGVLSDTIDHAFADEPDVKHNLSNETSIMSSPKLPSSSYKNVFGSPLDVALSISSHTLQGKYKIPSVVYRCLEYLYKNGGLHEQGIFRLSGSSAMIRTLQEKFDREHDVDLYNYNNRNEEDNLNSELHTTGSVDINTVAGLLKLYLRSLPHLIFGDNNYTAFRKVVENSNNSSEIAFKFKEIVNGKSIPSSHYSLMHALFEVLLRISELSDTNKMNVKNLCIVFSPTLNIPVNILQPFIVDFACIFNGGEPVSDSSREQIDVNIPQL
ncbi:hypothetical protein Kpol_479p4 [Vanderwaltozyma polyspora DSM 70294]|uniref:Rho-GAP domain-containing protein n=1 Tax=Vanderwaltozyma polyspora (strain ATCC 22028 / DSM 70294 / BCRC 21397 / CBS 2163 / NBRC 10782 / NRRL Y-8283 / UCD 57-17) TaxID=436907 RepID=A7TQB7_VANPO|nr:uncharacterized protein Kpol_479p4 [Vanderwaltozyma polyspora DSM 70294]EDO15516.1 hypothetical protein Kpol_479p4 [Vanderwaltozyma polyspora DSM 70294]